MTKSSARRPTNIHRIEQHRGYRFVDRDPVMQQVCNLINESDLSIGEIVEEVRTSSHNSAHVAYSTIANWLNGKTKRPQNFTIDWVLFAIGYERAIVKRK